jgi:hypothetical protein
MSWAVAYARRRAHRGRFRENSLFAHALALPVNELVALGNEMDQLGGRSAAPQLFANERRGQIGSIAAALNATTPPGGQGRTALGPSNLIEICGALPAAGLVGLWHDACAAPHTFVHITTSLLARALCRSFQFSAERRLLSSGASDQIASETSRAFRAPTRSELPGIHDRRFCTRFRSKNLSQSCGGYAPGPATPMLGAKVHEGATARASSENSGSAGFAAIRLS